MNFSEELVKFVKTQKNIYVYIYIYTYIYICISEIGI